MPTGQTVERLAGEILLNDLALEGDAMGSVGSVLELLSKVDGAVKSRGASFQLYIFQQLISQ